VTRSETHFLKPLGSRLDRSGSLRRALNRAGSLRRPFNRAGSLLRPFTLALACLAVGCAPKSGLGAKAPVGTSLGPEANGTPNDEGADKDTLPFGANCRIKTRKDQKVSLVACDLKEVMMILPGTGWTREPSGVPGMILLASRGLLNVSASVADTSETQSGLSEHLDADYQGVSRELGGAGFVVGKPTLEQMKNEHLVLFYELSGNLDGQSVRSANAFTAIRRSDRRYVDYHVSLTAPPDDPVWHETPPPLEVVKGLADLFFVADDNGKLPPQ
jgi:hypothetical protein